MIERGVVHNVDSATLGSYLAADAASSATSITVDLAVDFNEDGGSLSLNGDDYTYAAADADTGVITGLSPGLTGAALEGDRVDVLPVGVVKRAYVMAEHAEDSLTVRVPHTLMPLMVDGIRVEGEREVIQFDRLGDEFVITDLVGKEPVIDGATIDPHTLPPNPSDGLAPASSPTPAIAGGIRQFFLTWTPVANADPVTYDVHMSTVTGFTAVSGNLIGSTEGSTFVIQVENPDYAISYYMRIVARDADGPAPVGTEVSAMLIPINSPDIAADAIRANNILAGEIRALHFASNLLESGVIQTASVGKRVRLDSSGIKLIDADESLLIDLPTDADAIASFYGAVQTTSLTSLDNFEMRGSTNEQAVGSTYTLAAGITPSATPPTATPGYLTSATSLDNDFWATRGVDWGSTYNFYLRRFLGETQVLRQQIIGDVYTEPTFEVVDPSGSRGHGLAICNDSGVSEDRLYILVEGYSASGPTGLWVISKWDLTGWPTPTFVTEYPWTHDTGVNYFPPNIGRDFTADNFITAEVLANQTQIRFRRYAANNGSLVSTTTSASMGTSLSGMSDKTIRGVCRGSFGMGLGDLYCVAMTDRIWFFNVGDGSFVSTPGIGPSFFTNGAQRAFQWNTVISRFQGHNNDDTLITLYSDHSVTGNHSDTYQVGHTWVDSVGTTHQTPLSAQKAFVMKKRGIVTINTPPIPGEGGADEPNSVKIYCGGPSTTPLARTAMWDQSSQPAVGDTVLTLQSLRVASGGGAVNPPAQGTSDFPEAAAAIWQSGALGADSNPKTELSGDGLGRAQEVVIGHYARKTSNQTSTSTTLVSDNALFFPVMANGVYEVKARLLFLNNTSASSGRVAWNFPSGTYTLLRLGPQLASTSTPATTEWGAVVNAASDTVAPFGVPATGSPTLGIWFDALISVGATGGTATLRFSQNVAGGTLTHVAGGWIHAERVG